MKYVIVLFLILGISYEAASQSCQGVKTYDTKFLVACSPDDVYIKWPNYADFTTYYHCNGVGNPVLTSCPANQYFVYVLQACAPCEQYIPPVSCQNLKTQYPPQCVSNMNVESTTLSTTTSSSTAPPTVPPPTQPITPPTVPPSANTTVPPTPSTSASNFPTPPVVANPSTSEPIGPPTPEAPASSTLIPPPPSPTTATTNSDVPMPPTAPPTPPSISEKPPVVTSPKSS